MQITVKLFASFRVGRFRSEARTFPATTTIGNVADELGIAERDIGIVLRNGAHASLSDAVHEGDTISLMPQIGGG